MKDEVGFAVFDDLPPSPLLQSQPVPERKRKIRSAVDGARKCSNSCIARGALLARGCEFGISGVFRGVKDDPAKADCAGHESDHCDYSINADFGRPRVVTAGAADGSVWIKREATFRASLSC